jgi:hypothetical protein
MTSLNRSAAFLVAREDDSPASSNDDSGCAWSVVESFCRVIEERFGFGLCRRVVLSGIGDKKLDPSFICK